MAELQPAFRPTRPRRSFRLQVSLRTKLFVLILLVLSPLIVEDVEEVYGTLHSYTSRELLASQELAEATAAAFLAYVDSLWAAEAAIGSAVSLGHENLPRGRIEALLRGQLRYHPTVHHFTWIDPAGHVLAATLPNTRNVSLADRDHIRRIIQGEDSVISEVITSRVSGELTIIIARGVRRDGRLIAIITASVRLSSLGLALPMQRHGDSNFGLVDHSGRIVYHSMNPKLSLKQRGIRTDSPAWRALRGEVTLSPRYRSGIDGAVRMGAFVPIPRIGWAAFATAPVADVLAEAWSHAKQRAALLLLVIAVSLVVALLAGDAILRPVFDLQHSALAISNGDLNARVRDTGSNELASAAQAFNQMAERMQAVEAERVRFFQVAAHELRNPMAAIKGVSSLIQVQVAEGKPVRDVARMAALMEREIDRLSSLLNQLLEASLIHNRTNGPKMDRVNFARVVTAALGPFKASGSGKHRFILEGLDRDGVYVMGNSGLLEEVVRNLISNAVKYSPGGGDVRLTLRKGNRLALLSVTDNGVGIPKDQLEKIFESFYRAHNLSGKDPGGIGLGLYICRDIIRRHGGRIWAESEEDAGATLYIELPLCEDNL